MDHAEPPPDAPSDVMDVERVVREDGRLLLLFSWGAPDQGPGSRAGDGDA